jgi:hypothetical protein
MTGRQDSYRLLINCIPSWYTYRNERRCIIHIVKLLERRFPQHKGKITTVLGLVSISLLLLGLGLMFIR